MRKSVERRRSEMSTQDGKTTSFWRRHRFMILVLLLAISCAGLFLSYSNWKQITDAKALAARTAEANAELDKRVKAAVQKKIDDARRAEAEAKANAERAAAERKAQATAHPSVTDAGIAAKCATGDPGSITAVINKKHCFSPIDWAPNDLSSVGGYLLRAEAASQMAAMMNAAGGDGAAFELSSSYRSYANQQVTYNNWVAVNGSQAAADTVSARPGYSEHQTGLAADLATPGCVLECFGGSAAYTWLKAHATEYGFIERYPPGLTSITGYSPEAWHWRYVGAATAKDMKAKGIQTLEEYLGVSGGDYAS